MNYNAFIGSKIINKYGEQGEVVSFNEDRITVRYLDGEKTYNPEIAIRNGFLLFVDEKLKHQYNEELSNKDKAKKEQEEIARKIDEDRPTKIKKINELNKQYAKKAYVLQVLFGEDFVYPPYVEFLKKYKDLITRENRLLTLLFSDYYYAFKYR